MSDDDDNALADAYISVSAGIVARAIRAEPRSELAVVSAIIVRSHRVLLTQRRPDQDFPFLWETPGGKVEPAELVKGERSYPAALSRELKEELGLRVPPSSFVNGWARSPKAQARAVSLALDDFVVVETPQRTVYVSLYRVPLRPDQRPVPREGQGMGWFDRRELMALHANKMLAPANHKHVERLVWWIDNAHTVGMTTEVL